MAEATAREQLLLELINRGRLDPAGEAARYGMDLNAGLPAGSISTAAKQVLAFNPFLNSAADSHSQWMLDTDTFSHTGSGGSSPKSRMEAAGYVFSGIWSAGENIAWSGTTGALNADQEVLLHHQMLFESELHRQNYMNTAYREAGISTLTGVFTSKATNYNALMTTENFALSGSKVFVTGVTYTDSDNNDFYSIGEGAGGRSVQLLQNGSAIVTSASGTAGGYALGTTATGAVEVQFSGGGLAAVMGALVTLNGSNLKVDLVDGNTILSNASATLTQASANLTLIGIDAVSGTGNMLANILTGNGAANLLAGLAGNDTLNGGVGADVLQGGTGHDTLLGGAGNDRLTGGGGNDRITGGGGIDKMMGNAGADTFIFTAITDMTGGRDLIGDFAPGSDKIDLSAIDAFTGGGDNAFVLLANGASFSAGAVIGQLRVFQSATETCVEGDVNGDGVADLVFKLTGLLNPGASDFIL